LGVSREAAASVVRPLAVDLYAGAGGLSLGMEQAGFEVVAAAEFDPVHALTHIVNMPRTPVLCQDLGAGTVAEVAAMISEGAKAGWRLAHPTAEFPGLDAVVGGPPCQGFSVGGVRDAEDERNSQFLRFVDLVVELQPKVFCLENVAGLLEPRFEALRKEAIRRLTVDGGYALTGFDRPVNAAAFGVPQTRRRVIVTGSRVGDPPVAEPESGDCVTVAEALEGLPDIAQYRSLLETDQVRLREEDLSRLLAVPSVYARRMVGVAVDPTDSSWPRVFDTAVLTNSLRTVHKAKSVQRFARTSPGGVEKVSRLFRLDPSRQARTLRAGTGSDRGSHTSPRPIHPEKNRVITVREAARLHGYPDWFRFHATNWHGHRQVGNSVPPPLAAAVGRALMSGLGAARVAGPTERLALGDPSWLWSGRTEALERLSSLGAVLDI
jgi:DNA (cytosine-5)-methyltransferase 1